MNDGTPGQLRELHAEAALKQRMSDEGVDPGNPAEREAWESGYGAAGADFVRILHEVRERYARFSRGDDDIFRVLENRVLPLVPGEPVQFQKLGRRRWLNGTFGGLVDNPDDPNRQGD